MALSTLVLQETFERFQQRKTDYAKKQKAIAQLDKLGTNGFQKLVQLDSKERVAKRWQRLQNVASKSFVAIDAPNQDAFAKRIIGRNDLLQANYLDKGCQAARSVGRVVIKSSNQQVLGFGTGFMISPRLLMTNNHVLPNTTDALYSQVEMRYQLDISGNLLEPEVFLLDPTTFFYTSKELDLTIVAIKGGTVNNNIGWNKLIEAEGKVLVGEFMNIVQHPDGRPKEISFRSNRLMDVLPQFLHYETDTEPGSSGAPVFNDQWEIVALHHSGVPQRDSNGKIITRDGNIWTPEMGEAQVQWIANEGVRVSAIVKHLKSLKLTLDEKTLRNEIFDIDMWQPGGLVSSSTLTEGIHVDTNKIAITLQNQVYSLEIPLQLKIDSSLLMPEPPESPSITHIGTDDPTSIGNIHAAFQKRLDLTLQEVAAARSKPYYNKTEDEKHRKQYYKVLKTKALNSDAFYKQLSELIQQTHTQPLSYQPSKHVYTWVDWQPNKKLRSIYSWKEYSPEELIEQDMKSEMQFESYTLQVASEGRRLTKQTEKELALFEASLPYNCEHVVPQSWFGKKEPMRGDLHHLFTCEWGCNSFRNKIPYYDFTDFEEALRTDCGKRETNKFEPENGKGAVARATLYFLLRYPGQINANTNEYTANSIKMLLQWHLSHKVTLHEQHRNAAIFAMQGNRNPLIDHPEWAAKINFLNGLGKKK